MQISLGNIFYCFLQSYASVQGYLKLTAKVDSGFKLTSRDFLI